MVGRESLSLFGIDLVGIFDYWRDGMAEAAAIGWLRWLLPAEAIRIEHAEGRVEIRDGTSGLPVDSTKPFEGDAVMLPEELYLTKDVHVPQLSSRQMAAALGLQAEQLSPFGVADLVWGWRRAWRRQGAESVRIVMASRAAVERHLAERGHRDPAKVEVWVGDDVPILLEGFGESRRIARQSRHRILVVAAVAALLAMLLLFAALPVWRAHERLQQATRQMDQVKLQAAPAIEARERLVAGAEALDRLRARSTGKTREVEVLNALSEMIPDEAMLFRFELRGDSLRLSGQADDASLVLQLLSDSKAFSSVRSTGPFSRAANGRESFMFELQLDDKGSRP